MDIPQISGVFKKNHLQRRVFTCKWGTVESPGETDEVGVTDCQEWSRGVAEWRVRKRWSEWRRPLQQEGSRANCDNNYTWRLEDLMTLISSLCTFIGKRR